MTIPVPINAVSLSEATAVMLIDGAWIDITTGSLSTILEPTFTDPVTGQTDAPGGTWYQFQDTALTPQAYACPARSIAAVKLAAPISGGGSGGGGG